MISIHFYVKPHEVLRLICIIGFLQISLQYNEEEELSNVYQNITSDYQVFGRFVEAQVAPATEWDSIPAIGWLQPPGTPSYRIRRCKRVNVMNCTRGEDLEKLHVCLPPIFSSKNACNCLLNSRNAGRSGESQVAKGVSGSLLAGWDHLGRGEHFVRPQVDCSHH